MSKLKSLLFTLIFLLTAGVSDAQLRYHNGKLSINGAPENPDYELTINQWRGLKWSPKDGCYLLMDLYIAAPAIAGHGDQIAFYNPETNNFNSLLVSDVYNMSDSRAKKNVSTLSDCMQEILSLRPVSYQWKQNEDQNTIFSSETSSVMLSKGASTDNTTQYGFLAQEVEEVLPDAVKTMEDGTKLINYNSFIPLLVEALQSLQKTVEEQAVVIATMSDKLNVNSNVLEESSFSITPNRILQTATVEYNPPLSGKSTLKICDLSGNMKKEVALPCGTNSVSVDFSNFRPGLYIAAMSVDGVIVSSERIIKE